MSFLIAIIVGIIAGVIASAIVHDRLPLWLDAVVGIVGAFIGNLVVGLFGGPQVDLANPTIPGFLVAVLGSVILLFIVNAITRNRNRIL